MEQIFRNVFGIDPTQNVQANSLSNLLENVQTAVTATNTILATTNTAITNLVTANANKTTGKIVDVLCSMEEMMKIHTTGVKS